MRNNKHFHIQYIFLAWAICVAAWGAEPSAEISINAAYPALRDSVVLIIRHAEKPEEGYELSPAGRQRAEAYAHYFSTFSLDARPVKLDYLFATADTKSSHRPRLTLEPLSRASGLKIDVRFKTKQPEEFVREIETHEHGHHILIAWHHGEIPELLKGLGANPAWVLPSGKWPSGEYSWVLVLRYDHEGRLIPKESKCVHEKLMPGDE